MPLLILAYVFVLFFWFGLEDSSLTFPVVLGAGGALLAAAHSARGLWHQAAGVAEANAPAEPAIKTVRNWLIRLSATGALGGAIAPALAVALMVIKISLHGHPSPDFTLGEVIGLLWRTPLWAGAGLLTGFGAGLVRLGAQKQLGRRTH